MASLKSTCVDDRHIDPTITRWCKAHDQSMRRCTTPCVRFVRWHLLPVQNRHAGEGLFFLMRTRTCWS